MQKSRTSATVAQVCNNALTAKPWLTAPGFRRSGS